MHTTDKLFSSSHVNFFEQSIHLLQNKEKFITADRETYIRFNNQLKHKQTLQELSLFLQSLIQQQIFPNVFILNQMMEKLFRIHQVNLALKIFNLIIIHSY